MHTEAPNSSPGRVCPACYAYPASALQAPAILEVDTLYVAGGLYGNLEALDTLEALARNDIRDGQKVSIVFNGDFHWFDADVDWFMTVHERTQQWITLAGNVELELADRNTGAGCGCAYPPHVSDRVVHRSNAIMQRLQGTVGPVGRTSLERLPRLLAAQVGTARVLIVHGDTRNISGWRFAAEHLPPADSPLRERLGMTTAITDLVSLQEDFKASDADVIACSHTCLPAYCRLMTGSSERILANNGAAGMPNFDGMVCGLATRISRTDTPPPSALFGFTTGTVRCDAVKLEYDQPRWMKRFLGTWPEGSTAHSSYLTRLNGNVGYAPCEALRDFRSASTDT